MKGDKTNLDYYKAQLKLKVVDKLHERLRRGHLRGRHAHGH